jgi:hypothetical protein
MYARGYLQGSENGRVVTIAVNMARFGNANIMLHCKSYYHYYYIEFECFSFISGMGCYVLNIVLSSPSRTVFL